jgi:Flp pilus assembly protein TadD
MPGDRAAAVSLPNHREAAAKEVAQLMRRGVLTAALGFVLPVLMHILSLIAFVQAYDRGNEEFWKRKGQLALGFLTNLLTAAWCIFVLVVGFTKLERNLMAKMSFDYPKVYAEPCFDRLANTEIRLGDCEAKLKKTSAPKKLSRLHSTIGFLHLAEKRYSLALQPLDTAIHEDPQNVHAFLYRAALFEHTNDFDHAIADLNTAVLLGPKDADALTSRCLHFAIREEFAKAETDCRAALAIDEHAYDAHNGLALAALKQKDYRRAELEFHEALIKGSNSSASRYGRGLARVAQGNAAGKIDLSNALAVVSDTKQDFYEDTFSALRQLYVEKEEAK